MHIYSGIINLHGHNHHQVIRDDLTATEILMLRAIHGAATESGTHPVINNIKFEREVSRSDAEERARLIGAMNEGSVSMYREDQFRKVFVTDYIPLPQFLPGFEPVVTAPEPQPASETAAKSFRKKSPPAAEDALPHSEVLT